MLNVCMNVYTIRIYIHVSVYVFTSSLTLVLYMRMCRFCVCILMFTVLINICTYMHVLYVYHTYLHIRTCTYVCII